MSISSILCRRRTTVPAAPAAPNATGSDSQASVAFSVPVTAGGSPITLYRAISTPGSFTRTGAASPLVVLGLSNGTPYTFTVRATNAVGDSVESAASNSVTPAPVVTAPGAPTGVSAVKGNAQATISFSPPGDDGGSAIFNYFVTSTPGDKFNNGAASPIVVSGLTNGTAYTFTVQAQNAVGYGAASAASAAVTPSTVPGAPGTPTASNNGSGSVSLTVSYPADEGGSNITHFTAYANPGPVTARTAVGGFLISMVVNGLTNGVNYTFTMRAENINGLGAASGASNSVLVG